MPSDYDGAIFITDIDETLRDNVKHQPIPGCQDILYAIQGLGVPILYLTAASFGWRSLNREFLRNFPAGILVDRDTWDNRKNVDYKTSVILTVQRFYPHAVLVCMGDNETHDAKAYTNCAGGSFIREVRRWDTHNRPSSPPSNMICYKEYGEPTKENILDVLSQVHKKTHPFEWQALGLQETTVGSHVNR